MKNRKILALLVCFTLILSACAQETAPSSSASAIEEEPLNSPITKEEEEPLTTSDTESAPGDVTEQFEIFSPYEALSEKEIIHLGADGFSGSDEEIARSILDWQRQHMQYIGDPRQKPDISHPMRWNYFLPGIFPVSEMIQERVLDNGLIYGLCWDYAAIYSAIANYYGLETRVTAFKVYMSDTNPSIDKSTANGMGPDEFEAMKPLLERHELSLSYDQISRAARETWSHYRAEVNIEGKWTAFDGVPSISDEYADDVNYDVAPWDEGYDPDLLYKEGSFGNNGMPPQASNAVDLHALSEMLASAPAPGYEGITDAAGNPNRAASMEDLLAGKGLVPYFQDTEKINGFLKKTIESDEIRILYEEGTGKKFYCIADEMIYTMEEITAEEYIPLYNALTGEEMTEEEFLTYVQ
ncbi:MAG: hypothetical protein Q7J07_03365 [Pelolinea sp.]|nr:hypothetical protein [Pelolinea sp.]